MFIETGGYINKTARRTGFSKSTVSRYVQKSGWREELLQTNRGQIDQQTKGKDIMNELPPLTGSNRETIPEEGKANGEAEGQVLSKLVALRGLLFEEIMGNERVETLNGSSLRMPPKTLAEAVRALVDIDKRISEREGTQPDTYQRILERCAIIVGKEPE